MSDLVSGLIAGGFICTLVTTLTLWVNLYKTSDRANHYRIMHDNGRELIRDQERVIGRLEQRLAIAEADAGRSQKKADAVLDGLEALLEEHDDSDKPVD